MKTVAALYIDPKGPYPKMPGVECWDESRDARLYAGPHPVVAHPPCGRWCRLAGLVEARWGHKKGDDGGCFRFALESVRRWGGVLEHPAHTDAWAAYELDPPPRRGWQRTFRGEWVCQLSQAAWGHRAPKETWLLLVGGDPLETDWSRPKTEAVISGAANRCSVEKRVWSAEARKTPPRFADFLVSLARRCVAPALALTGACSFDLPENPLRDPVPSWIPEPGARPEAFECELAGVTASGDEPHWTRFEGDRFEPVRVYSEDAVTDVELGGVSVIVVGDVFVVGGQWIRLGECE